MVTHLDVQYQTAARDERGTSLKRADEAASKIRFSLIVATRKHDMGIFSLAEMRLMLGSTHPHYLYIVKELVKADNQADDEDEPGWDASIHTKQFTGAEGLEYEIFKPWARKFRGAKSFTEYLT